MKALYTRTKIRQGESTQVSKGGEADLHHHARLAAEEGTSKANLYVVKLDAEISLLDVGEHHF